MNITRKEFIQGLVETLEYEGLEVNLFLTSTIVEYIEKYMVPKPIEVVVGNRNGLDIIHNINRFRSVHKKCVD